MSTIELMPHLPPLSSQEAEQWIRAALADAKALRQHDARLYPLTADPAASSTATALHDAWRQWAENADAILGRLTGAATAPAGLHELRVAIGYARGLAGLSPEETLRRRNAADASQPRLYTTEEARRELGIAPRR